MSKFFIVVAVAVLLAIVVSSWMIFRSGTGFNEKVQYFIVEEGKTDKSSVLDAMQKNHVLASRLVFSAFTSGTNVFARIRPGKYEVKKGQSMWSIARMLKNGKIAEIKLVITKIRLKEDLARLISRNFAPDSVSVMNYLNSNDSLKQYGVDTSTALTMVIPDTYTFYWNTTVSKIFRKLYGGKEAFWSRNSRAAKAERLGLTEEQVYILASIVEEETNVEADKYNIASVYLNRLNRTMPLQACPTIKYAMKDFGLTRIYEKYLFNPSPYNTYHRTGLPPGPICTPSPRTIDIVLNAPKTDYLFFVASADFSGRTHFSSTFSEHSEYAKLYQKALDARMPAKKH